jgi:hypothetical protein
MQKFLGKLNYLRRFISNLLGKIRAFASILRLKNEAKFTWRADQQCAFEDIKSYLTLPLLMKAPMAGILFAIHRCQGCHDWGCFDARNGGQGSSFTHKATNSEINSITSVYYIESYYKNLITRPRGLSSGI